LLDDIRAAQRARPSTAAGKRVAGISDARTWRRRAGAAP